MKRHIFLYILLIIIVFGCENENTIVESQFEYIFQKEYCFTSPVSPAETTYMGWFIDASGTGYSFDKRYDDWSLTVTTDVNGTIIKSRDLIQNISLCEEGSFSIDTTEVIAKLSLLDEALSGELSDRQALVADVPSTRYSAYILNEDRKSYTHIFLYEGGGFEITNNTEAADILKEWLIGIDAGRSK